jgi:hypothetical protein
MDYPRALAMIALSGCASLDGLTKVTEALTRRTLV